MALRNDYNDFLAMLIDIIKVTSAHEFFMQYNLDMMGGNLVGLKKLLLFGWRRFIMMILMTVINF